MKLIGFDSAVQEKNIGLVLCDYENGSVTIEDKKNPGLSAEEQIVRWIKQSSAVIIGIDSPLGWPYGFGKNLAPHRAGEALGTDAETFFERETDREIYRIFKKKPLEVSADRIGRTAFFTLERIKKIGESAGSALGILWSPKEIRGVGFIEVYPAATLLANGISVRGYKDSKEIRDRILDGLHATYRFAAHPRIDLTTVDHDFDAFVCCLALCDFMENNAARPPELTDRILTEGWIWTKAKGPETRKI